MGWHQCERCGSDKWEIHQLEKGCNMCNPKINAEINEEVADFFKRHAGEKLIGGMAISKGEEDV